MTDRRYCIDFLPVSKTSPVSRRRGTFDGGKITLSIFSKVSLVRRLVFPCFLCSFLPTTTSIVLVILIFLQQTSQNQRLVSDVTLAYLQRTISSLSLVIASAVIIIAGK